MLLLELPRVFLIRNVSLQNTCIYEEKDKIVVVILAGTLENFYEELKRYMK